MADYGRDKGLFIPTTQVWDTSEIYEAKGVSEDLRELLVRMYQNLNNMAMAVNKKDTGIYHTDEFVCGQTFFPNPAYSSSSTTTPTLRQIYRKVIRWQNADGSDKALPNGAGAPPGVLTQQAHGIPLGGDYMFTRIYGTSFDSTNGVWFPVPYFSGTNILSAGNYYDKYAIELWVDLVNVNIVVYRDRTMHTRTFVVLEYMKT